MKSKKAKFFCENCGAEVDQSARFCKKCGRFFTSVRCPCCGFSGPANDFTNGCPNCGYAEGKGSKLDLFNTSLEKKKEDSPLPVWIYLFSIAGLIGLISALIYLYTS